MIPWVRPIGTGRLNIGATMHCYILNIEAVSRPGAKYIEKYSNTLQLLSLINDYNYITITGPIEM